MDRTDLFNKVYDKTNLNPHKLNDFKKTLIERGGFLIEQLESARKWHKERNTDPIGCPEIGILTNEIIENDIQISIIEDELSRLQREKAENNTNRGKGGKRAEKACTEKAKFYKPFFEKILFNLNVLLFEKSTIKQWICILNNQTPPNQIIVKKEVTFKDLRYFFDKLKDNDIFEIDYIKPLIELEAFYTNRKLCTLEYSQLVEGLRSAKTAIPPLINEIDSLFDK